MENEQLERLVEERLQEEWREVFERLEEDLDEATFLRVARLLVDGQ